MLNFSINSAFDKYQFQPVTVLVIFVKFKFMLTLSLFIISTCTPKPKHMKIFTLPFFRHDFFRHYVNGKINVAVFFLLLL